MKHVKEEQVGGGTLAANWKVNRKTSKFKVLEFHSKLASADESVLDDDLLASAAVLDLLESLHPECMRMKSL